MAYDLPREAAKRAKDAKGGLADGEVKPIVS